MKTLINWRHQYDIKRDQEEGDAAALHCEDESLTQQHFTKDADINEIARRFGLVDVPLTALDPSLFRDTTNDPDLTTILDQRREAIEYFMALPAKMKARFHNSPNELYAFVLDPDNAEEAVRLGLLTPKDTATADQGKTTAGATTPPAPASSAPTANSMDSSSAAAATASNTSSQKPTGDNPPNTPRK